MVVTKQFYKEGEFIMDIVKDQEDWNACVANGWRVCNIPEDKLKKVPQESWNARVVNGNYASDIPEDILEKVPQESWNTRVANGLGLSEIPKDKLKKVPQESWAVRFSLIRDYDDYKPHRYRYSEFDNYIKKKKLKQYYKDNPALKSEDETAREYAWETKSKETYETKYQLDIEKYRNGDIKISDIDINVFGNDYAVIDIIEVAHEKARKQFDKLCQKYGFTDDSQIPNDLVENFNQQLQKIDKAIKEKRIFTTKKIVAKDAAIKAKENAEKVTSELDNMEV